MHAATQTCTAASKRGRDVTSHHRHRASHTQSAFRYIQAMLRRSVAAAALAVLTSACRPVQEVPQTQAAPVPAAPVTNIVYTAPFDGDPLRTRTLDHGIVVDDFVDGEGRDATKGSVVRYHYTGYLTDGRVFHDTRKKGRKRPTALTVGANRGLPGLHAVLAGVRAGSKLRVHLPADQAYGRNRYKIVQPHSPIVLTIEVVGVDPPMAAPQPETAFAGEPMWTQTRGEGLVVSEFREGSGAPAQGSDEVTFHFIGKLDDGTVFETSHESEPIEVGLDNERVMTGLRLGLEGSKLGALRKLVVPPKLGLDGRKRKGVPPDTTTTYLVEVVRVRPAI